MTSTTHSPLSLRRATSRVCIAVVVVAASCIDPYPPPVSKGEINYLVVDGFLNSGSGLASVKLSRAMPLDSEAPQPVVRYATVTVEKEDGTMFFVPEIEPGKYETIRPILEIGARYRLMILSEGQSYESDFVTLKQSPELEDISWTADDDNNGITIHVDARDPSGTTRYYQWLYTETWEYDADVASGWFVRNGFAVQRNASQMMHICYKSVESSKVLISTTSDQSGDFINDYPLVHIDRGSKKLCRHYSILVQQRALDESSYNYWLQLQRTTENLGGLFDPLPARVTGNVRATTDPEQKVLGYFSGGGVQEKRMYIDFRNLPNELRFTNRMDCQLELIGLGNLDNYLDGTALAYPNYPPGALAPDGYMIAPQNCMDCRIEGGVLTKPSFWPF